MLTLYWKRKMLPSWQHIKNGNRNWGTTFVKSMNKLSLLFPVLVLTLLTGCSSQKAEREFISDRPKALPVNKHVLQGMQPNSTELLKKAELWYENSGKLLDSVTEPSLPSVK